MSSLTEHARRELTLIGEEPAVIDWCCRVIDEFASFGHSGSSAFHFAAVLYRLLQLQPLRPLTDDPAEWYDHGEMSGTHLWQNRRDGTAFSEDGGKTYYLLSEREAAGSAETTPLHVSEKHERTTT